MSTVHDKNDEPIEVGDTVSTKFRGGKRAGVVKEVVLDEEEAAAKGVKHPPKVIFKDQHGHEVAHNPGTLVHGDDPKKK
ncbi:hypothetical protein BDN72DRAFT_845897 [Pluteus cervinus]|uniref:Uncharacterized protein n=1 Tax=Pluteus cervinus TaxID=181527 RepID=A0ACD3AHZ4_9AGAR|nr:hypothetical protein BDN72DRAFT_845897 [Pluteus cervinus]